MQRFGSSLGLSAVQRHPLKALRVNEMQRFGSSLGLSAPPMGSNNLIRINGLGRMTEIEGIATIIHRLFQLLHGLNEH